MSAWMSMAFTGWLTHSIVAAFSQGHSPETIRQQYPALSLEQVYGSIAFYLSNFDEVKAYLDRQDAVWQEWKTRTEQEASPVVERLRQLSRAFLLTTI